MYLCLHETPPSVTGCARRCSVCVISVSYIGVQGDGWKRDTHLGRIRCRMPTGTAEGGIRQDDSLSDDGLLNRGRVISL